MSSIVSGFANPERTEGLQDAKAAQPPQRNIVLLYDVDLTPSLVSPSTLRQKLLQIGLRHREGNSDAVNFSLGSALEAQILNLQPENLSPADAPIALDHNQVVREPDVLHPPRQTRPVTGQVLALELDRNPLFRRNPVKVHHSWRITVLKQKGSKISEGEEVLLHVLYRLGEALVGESPIGSVHLPPPIFRGGPGR